MCIRDRPSFVHCSLLRNGNHTLHQKKLGWSSKFWGVRTPDPSSGFALAMLARYMLWHCVRPSVRHNRYRIETAEQIQLVLGSKSSLNESYTVHVVRELGCRQTLGQGLLPSGILFHLNLADLGATVCKTVRPMLSVCQSVCAVGVLWPSGWMD